MREYNEIMKRCKEQGIDTTGCHLYFTHGNLDGQSCLKGTLSQDGCWICIPTKEYCPDFDEDIYMPKCYEIKEKFTTYLKNDHVWYLVECFLLYGENVKVVS